MLRDVRFWGSLVPPLLALGLQLLIWPLINPFVWFLFFPAVFVSAWIGPPRGGLAATMLSASLVWWFFVEPTHMLVKDDPKLYFPLVMFLMMGALFTAFQERLKRSGDRVRQSREGLARANARAERLLAKAQESELAKSEFFANISHELRTPLTLILGPTEMMLAGADATATQRRHLESIDRQAHHLLRLVNELLEGSKFESGLAVLQPATVDLARLVRSVTGQFEAVATSRRIELTVTADSAVLAAVDPDRVQRAVTNLVSNALKFTPAGGTVRVHLSRSGASAAIEVADSGPGVPKEHRDLVFERFRQVEGDAARVHGGTGLGLAIARDIAELHGGSLALDEAPGGGALFTLRLPLGNPTGAAEEVALEGDVAAAVNELLATAMPATPTTLARGRGRILVIEDNPDLAAFIAESLSPRYTVEVAADGQKGVDAARRTRPDLILCDVMMPVLTGEQVVAAVKADAGLAGVPIVMLTARADERTRLDLFRAGATDFLAKPFNVAELCLRVDNLVQLRRTQSHLADALTKAEGLLEASPYATLVVDESGTITRASRQASVIFGYRQDELVGRPVEMLLPATARDGHPALRAGFARHPHPRNMGTGLDLTAVRADGSAFPVDVSLAPLETSAGPLVIAAIRDVSDQREAHARLEHLALHDPLTALPNRTLFLRRLADTVAAAHSDRALVVVFFIDVDRFKAINDSYGHEVGDAYLLAVAERLRSTVRPQDTVGRLGGDEFAIIAAGLASDGEAVRLAERVQEALRAPLHLQDHVFHPTASIGIASTGSYDAAPDELLGAADMAMYRAKTQGRDRVELFDESLRTLAEAEFFTMRTIRTALETDGLLLYYQPIVDARSGRVVRAEALVRIDDADRGVLPPDDFLEIAEETGLILPIGAWVVEEACRQLAAWQGAGIQREMSVNISGRQLNDTDIDDLVLSAAAAAGTDVRGLILEVTETALMAATPDLLARLARLKDAGVRLSIDDFGTGWSSLRYLQTLPVDEVKIDRTFTSGLGTRQRDTAIVTAVISLAGALGMRTTVEGIETTDQAEQIRSLDCDNAQGYLYGRPVAACEFDLLDVAHLDGCA